MLRYLCYGVSYVKRSPTMRSITNQSSAIVITGGLEKFHGGLKEESYFLNENNKLITRMQQHGLQQNAEKINHNLLNTKSAYVQPRVTCSLSKHKNYQEEAFFFMEQNECTKRFSKRMSDENVATDREAHDEDMLLKLQRLTTRIYPKHIQHLKMSQVGELGSGAGKGGGGGGSIREAGGSFGKMEAAREEEFFYKQQKEQLRNLKENTTTTTEVKETTQKN